MADISAKKHIFLQPRREGKKGHFLPFKSANWNNQL